MILRRAEGLDLLDGIIAAQFSDISLIHWMSPMQSHRLGMSEEQQPHIFPKVDVIVPTYDYGHYLNACLASIRAQTYADYSVLIIDNASEDDTEKIARHWQNRDSRFRYVRNDTNLGLMASVLKAYALTRAELVLFLSADDLLEPRFLALAVGALDQHPECTFAYSAWKMFVDDPGSQNHGAEYRYFSPHDCSGCYDEAALLLAHNWITNSFTLFRREVCDAVGGVNPTDLQHVGDWYTWMLFSAKGPACYIHERLGRYRIHANTETNRLVANYRSGYDHIRFYDLIFESELWPMPIRLAAKAHQSRWLTGEPLTLIARKMGGERAEPLMRHFVSRYRDAFYVAIAQSVLQYTPSKNFLDTPENALALLREVLLHDSSNAQAAMLYQSYRGQGRSKGLLIT